MKFVVAGYLSRTHGIKGELVLKPNELFNPKTKVLYIRRRGSEIPYFIEAITLFKDGFRLKLENVDDLNSSAPLKNSEILLEEKHAKKVKEFVYANYKIFNEAGIPIGIIHSVEGSENNPLLVVKNEDHEFLLPFQRDLILKINKVNKEIFFRVPDGLLEL